MLSNTELAVGLRCVDIRLSHSVQSSHYISPSVLALEIYLGARPLSRSTALVQSPKYNADTMPQTAALLFSEYICLAIMSFPYSYSVLGLVPGLILTVVVAALVLYTSLVVW